MTSATPSGRLTLSWAGKDRALLGTGSGGYEWVEPDDPRLLLHERETVGELTADAGAGNLLVVGDVERQIDVGGMRQIACQ